MNIAIHADPDGANEAAAGLLSEWLLEPSVRTVMVAAGNTPLDLYRRIATHHLPLAHLTVFALDEYVGVPPEHPRNCANLLRRSVADAWGIPSSQFFALTSVETGALESVQEHERRIARAGGLDLLVLGLGQNGHLGFNEPGSAIDSTARVLPLAPISIEANRTWFAGDHAPALGVTVGMKTILEARRILILAYGPHKSDAVRRMAEGPVTTACPASLLQGHPRVNVFIDAAAAVHLVPNRNRQGWPMDARHDAR